MNFDFLAFLDNHYIEYVDSGPNVKRGNVNIKCPFCGSNDPSHHMGIDPTTNYWACWRDKTHRGRSPVRLIMALAHCDYETAKELVGKGGRVLDEDLLTSIADGGYFNSELVPYGKASRDRSSVEYPSDIRLFDGRYSAEKPFKAYLESRGFADVDSFIRAYKLAYAVTGTYKNRIIIPYFDIHHRLVTFSGRSIYRGSNLRYRELPKEYSAVHSKQMLYNENLAANGGKVLFIVEGPIDVLKMDNYGKHLGCRAVGLSSVALTDEQLVRMMDLVDRYKRVCLVVDDGYVAQQQQILDQLSVVVPAIPVVLPDRVEDPGALTKSQVVKLCKTQLRRLKGGRRERSKGQRRVQLR